MYANLLAREDGVALSKVSEAFDRGELKNIAFQIEIETADATLDISIEASLDGKTWIKSAGSDINVTAEDKDALIEIADACAKLYRVNIVRSIGTYDVTIQVYGR